MLFLRFLATTVLITFFSIHVVDAAVQVTGATSGYDKDFESRPLRLEINEFKHSGASWDLYVQALKRFQDADYTDPLSYFQIAGIHGYPTRPWDVVAGSSEFPGGFCYHNSVLFPIWHRPYLALYEQVLTGHAKIIAKEYSSQQRDQYIAAAEKLRVPYWDWAHPDTARMPDVVTTKLISINTPAGWQSIENPLVQYTFPVNMSASNHFPLDLGFDDTARMPHTVRWPIRTTDESDQSMADGAIHASSTSQLDHLYSLFSSTGNYTQFSAYMLGATVNPSNYNLETLHGLIHNDIGGQNARRGHMTITAISAYDPAFWLHHANVDRILAMWQAIYPDSYVEPVLNMYGTYYQDGGSIDTIDTPLAPFHSDNVTMWTAASARDVTTFGYTYPELNFQNLSTSAPSAMVVQEVNQLYTKSNGASNRTTLISRHQRSTSLAQIMSNIDAHTAVQLGVNNMNVRWYLQVSLEAAATAAGISMYFFIGEPTKSIEYWAAAGNLMGSYVPQFSMHAADLSSVQSDISCSHTLVAAVDRGVLHDMRPETVVPFLKSYVRVKSLDSNGAEIDLSANSAIQISILSRDVQPRKSLSEFPVYGDFVDHGGLSS